VSDTLQLDLSVVLPHAHDAKDQCVVDLVAALEHLDGVESAHVVPTDTEPQNVAAHVCLHVAVPQAQGSSAVTAMR